MLCERYKKALMDAAAGAELSSAVRDHFAECAACRAALSAEQLLIASIETSLRQRTNVQLPQSFASRVMARAADETSPEPRWSYAWAAAVAVATLSIGIGLAWGFRHRTPIRDRVQTTVANKSLQPKHESVPTVGTVGSAPSPRHARHAERRRSHGLVRDASFQVLVSADQRAITDRLVEKIQRGEIDGQVLVSSAHEDLEIAPIVIAPLPSLSPEPGSGELPDTSGLPVNTEFSQDTNRRTP